MASMELPVMPPIAPMLSKAVPRIPEGAFSYEPKWDGFRSIVFRDGDMVEIGSRNERPMTRYFPEIVEAVKANLPEKCVIDGEIIVVVGDRLEFEVLQQRIHPAASRVRLLSQETPASFIAFDLLALNGTDFTDRPFEERRAALEKTLAGTNPPIHLTPATRIHDLAVRWFSQFEGAGLDGVVAKRHDLRYLPGKREMAKIKHLRTADCVVAGFRWHKNGPGTHVGSLLLGLYDDEGTLHHVGVTSSFTWDKRAALAAELEPLRANALEGHPWAEWAEWAMAGAADASGQRLPGATSRWNRGKDLSWEPLRAERVVEVAYDHLQGDRFRHGTTFRRWRPDKPPPDCRYDQLETSVPFELARIFGGE